MRGAWIRNARAPTARGELAKASPESGSHGLADLRFHPNLDTGLNVRVNRITRDRKEEAPPEELCSGPENLTPPWELESRPRSLG